MTGQAIKINSLKENCFPLFWTDRKCISMVLVFLSEIYCSKCFLQSEAAHCSLKKDPSIKSVRRANSQFGKCTCGLYWSVFL